jgi:inorganic pyrophosphatase
MQVAFQVPPYKEVIVSEKGKMDYRVFQTLGDKTISLWHDVPLIAGKSETGDYIFNYVHEITRGDSFKLEVCKSEKYNPVKHDLKDGKIRVVNYHPFTFNYGMFPQTWENPNEIDELTKLKGDGDPLDVVEIGIFPHRTGEISFVKVVGAIGLIDEGETDWKIIAINVNDPKAHFINGEADLKKHKIGAIEAITEFFVNYKTVDGKPKNTLALNGKLLEQESTLNLIFKMNDSYKKNVNALQKE